jgi:hypothetical protein
MPGPIRFHLWQLAVLALALVILTVLLTGLVVVNWTDSEAVPKAVPVAGISTPPPACESSPREPLSVERSNGTPQGSSPARPRMAAAAGQPSAVTAAGRPPQPATVVPPDRVPSGDEATWRVVVENTERPWHDASRDGEAPRASKAPRPFTFKSPSRYDDARVRATLNESP